MTFGRPVPLCKDCQRIERRMAGACRDRERAAKAKGQDYECKCPGVTCHRLHHEKASQNRSEEP